LLECKSILDFPVLELARQITLIESCIFRNINPLEFNIRFYSKKKVKQTLGIDFYIKHFNRTTNWIITEVLKKRKIKHRLSIIAYLLELAKECLDLGNLNAFVEILSALNSPQLSKFSETWKAQKTIQKKQYEEYKEFMFYTEKEDSLYNIRQILSKNIAPMCSIYRALFFRPCKNIRINTYLDQ